MLDDYYLRFKSYTNMVNNIKKLLQNKKTQEKIKENIKEKIKK
jgi:hypothetical protein